MRRIFILVVCGLALLLGLAQRAHADELTFWQGALFTGPYYFAQDPAVMSAFTGAFFTFYAADSFDLINPTVYGPENINSGPFDLTFQVAPGFQVDGFTNLSAFGPGVEVTAPDGFVFIAGGTALTIPFRTGNTWNYVLDGDPGGNGGGDLAITDLGPTPEPSSFLLFAIGLIAMLAFRRIRTPRLSIYGHWRAS